MRIRRRISTLSLFNHNSIQRKRKMQGHQEIRTRVQEFGIGHWIVRHWKYSRTVLNGGENMTLEVVKNF
jgi:hypothetical protein